MGYQVFRMGRMGQQQMVEPRIYIMRVGGVLTHRYANIKQINKDNLFIKALRGCPSLVCLQRETTTTTKVIQGGSYGARTQPGQDITRTDITQKGHNPDTDITWTGHT